MLQAAPGSQQSQQQQGVQQQQQQGGQQQGAQGQQPPPLVVAPNASAADCKMAQEKIKAAFAASWLQSYGDLSCQEFLSKNSSGDAGGDAASAAALMLQLRAIDAGFAQQKAAKQQLRGDLRGLIESLSALEAALGAEEGGQGY